MTDLARIPDEIIERIAEAMVGKWLRLAHTNPSMKEVVQTTVADVCLVLEGSVPIEAYEMGYPEVQRAVQS